MARTPEEREGFQSPQAQRTYVAVHGRAIMESGIEAQVAMGELERFVPQHGGSEFERAAREAVLKWRIQYDMRQRDQRERLAGLRL
jgi:hypothetical protein